MENCKGFFGKVPFFFKKKSVSHLKKPKIQTARVFTEYILKDRISPPLSAARSIKDIFTIPRKTNMRKCSLAIA